MRDPTSLLTVLQHGDSFFPSGAVSFSWGLETLCAENAVTDAKGVEAFIRSQLVGRWADLERNVVVAAHRVAGELDAICGIDAIVHAQTLAAEMREGSSRSGIALLSVHEKLETPGSAAYLERVRGSAAYGHLSVMQGFLWARMGVGEPEAQAISAHGLCVGLIGAGLRLGVIGHTAGQSILTNLHQTIGDIMTRDVLPIEDVHAFAPRAEIAVMRHEAADSRLFAN